MKSNELEELVRDRVRSSIVKRVNEEEPKPIEENTELAVAGITAAAMGFGWMKFRSAVVRSTRSQAFTAFIEEYDKEGVVFKKVPDLVRRFQLVKSLNDLETMERRADELVKQMQNLEGRVDLFINQQDKFGDRLRDKVAGLSGPRLRREIVNHITDIIGATRKGFEQEIENKKDELLGEI